MPTIKVTLLKGRTIETKRKLATEITQTMINILNSKPEEVHIIFDEVSESDWIIGNELEEILHYK